MAFLVFFLLALLIPILSFMGVGIALIYGATGVGTLVGSLCVLGLVTDVHVRRRTNAASLTVAAEPAPSLPKNVDPAGRVDFSVAAHLHWSWPREHETGDKALLPRVKGALTVQMRHVTTARREESVLLDRPARERMMLPRLAATRVRRVAVVTNDADYGALMARLLEARGWHVALYGASDVALAAVQSERPDLVILDRDIQGAKDGDTTLDLLTLDPATAGIPLIICARDAGSLQGMEQWLDTHGIVLLPKPFTADDLYTAIDAAIDRWCGGQSRPFSLRTYRLGG